jgi:transcriptional regulator with XRE-family HTH domain
MVLEDIDVGARIASARIRYGMTQRALAARIGVSVKSMSAIERGVTEGPDARIIAAIARVLGCTTDYLLGLSNELTVDREK